MSKGTKDKNEIKYRLSTVLQSLAIVMSRKTKARRNLMKSGELENG